MRSRSDDIRKRIEKRKKEQERLTKQTSTQLSWTEDEERYGFQKMDSYESGPIEEANHPLFRKEVFIFKILASACLVLIVAIMFRNQTPILDPAKEFVTKSMHEDFQFAAVSDWYESTFGKQLALLPTSVPDKNQIVKTNQNKCNMPYLLQGKFWRNLAKTDKESPLKLVKARLLKR